METGWCVHIARRTLVDIIVLCCVVLCGVESRGEVLPNKKASGKPFFMLINFHLQILQLNLLVDIIVMFALAAAFLRRFHRHIWSINQQFPFGAHKFDTKYGNNTKNCSRSNHLSNGLRGITSQFIHFNKYAEHNIDDERILDTTNIVAHLIQKVPKNGWELPITTRALLIILLLLWWSSVLSLSANDRKYTHYTLHTKYIYYVYNNELCIYFMFFVLCRPIRSWYLCYEKCTQLKRKKIVNLIKLMRPRNVNAHTHTHGHEQTKKIVRNLLTFLYLSSFKICYCTNSRFFNYSECLRVCAKVLLAIL